MKQLSWFEDWFNSPYYKKLYNNRDYSDAALFIDSFVKKFNPQPNAKILDVGCGEGRFAIQFAQKGFDVTGIDLAEQRIEKAKLSETDHLHFFIHDMRLPFYINYFDFTLNLFTSFGYFDQEKDNISAANAIAKGLKKGGHFVFDYLNKMPVIHQLIPHQVLEKEDVIFKIHKYIEGQYIYKKIDFLDSQNKERSYTERVTLFNAADIQQLFESQGLKLINSFGDYQFNTYNPQTSDRMILIFQKL
jgi:SAM-dependent methyltransferase